MINISNDNPSFHWLCLSPGDARQSELPTSQRNVVTVQLAGDLIIDQESLMRAISTEMHFPAYFGYNWNALEDCLRDLQWIPADNYCFIWKDAQKLLLNAPLDFVTFLDVFFEVSEWWHEQGTRFQLWIMDDLIMKIVRYSKDAIITQ